MKRLQNANVLHYHAQSVFVFPISQIGIILVSPLDITEVTTEYAVLMSLMSAGL